MEGEIMPFIFGMLAMIGIATVVMTVISFIKSIKTGNSIKALWTTQDRNTNSLYENLYKTKDELQRGFNEQLREVSLLIESNQRILEESLSREVDELTRQIDALHDYIDTNIASCNDAIADAIDEMEEDLVQVKVDLEKEISVHMESSTAKKLLKG